MLKLLVLVLMTLGLCVSDVLAAFSLSIVGGGASEIISKEQEMEVRILVSDLPDTSYFRVGIDSGNTYVGYMKNNDGQWVKLGTLTEDKNNLQCSQYFAVTTNGEYVLNFKIGSDIDVANGSHILKVHRLRESCTADSLTAEVGVNVVLPTPAPVPTASPTPTPTATPAPTPSPTATAKPTTTPKPAVKATATAKATEAAEPSEENDEEEKVLGVESGEVNEKEDEEKEAAGGGKLPWVAGTFVLMGLGLVGVGTYPFYSPYLRKYVWEKYNLKIRGKNKEEA